MSLLIVIVVTAALRAPMLGIPLERDEGEYAYIAWRLSYGELPYRDWVDQKPPGVFWVYRLGLDLPFEPVRSIHLMALLFSAGSACALFLVARRFMKSPWAESAALLFALLSAHPLMQGASANTEIFMLFPLLLSHVAFFAAVDGSRFRPWLMLLTGVLTGVAMSFKQVAAVNWPFLMIMYAASVSREKRLRDMVSFAAWSIAGLSVVWGAIWLYFRLRHGAQEFMYCVFTHNLDYMRALSWEYRWKRLSLAITDLAPIQILIWVLAGIGICHCWLAGRRQAYVYVAGGLVCAIVGVSASGYFFLHYFQQILPALALAAVAGAEFLWSIPAWSFLSAPNRGLALAILLGLLPSIFFYPFIFTYTPTEAIRQVYPAPLGELFARMPDLAGRVAQLTSPGDRVYIWGSEPELLFYAQRASATRYIILFPVYGDYPDARSKQMGVATEITKANPVVALAIPDPLLGGQEHFLTDWTSDYFGKHFRLESGLALDAAGRGRLTSADAVLNQQFLGGIFVRKSP